MRRWFAILLLVLLPLQFSWAAVANYCGRETGPSADHVGHHDHLAHAHAAGVASPGDTGSVEDPSTAPSGFDCGHCHGHCVGMLDVPPSLAPAALGGVPPRLGDAADGEHVPAQPERPQWAPLA